jgi:probable rRNA maturation factor
METMTINQQNKIKYDAELARVINRVTETIGKMRSLPANTEVSILLVDNNYIHDLNRVYRNQDKATDVLSFAMNEQTEEEPEVSFEEELNMLGDIVISLEMAYSQSIEYGHSLARELGFLVAHGMLHLLGLDHDTEAEEKEMLIWQEKVLQSINLER